MSGSTVQVGTNAATPGSNAFQAMTTPQYWAQTGLNALAKGAISQAQGGKFADGVVGSVIGSFAASGAGIIGDMTQGNTLANMISHAVLGCAVAAAGKQDCASGALGGASSALIARAIDGTLPSAEIKNSEGKVLAEGMAKGTRDAIIAAGSITGASLLTGALGGDRLTAGNAAANEVTNNYLAHDENEARALARKGCSSGNNSDCQKANDLDALDKQRDKEFHTACDGALSVSAGCANATRDLYAKLGSFATTDARNTAAKDQTGELTQAHKDELQSYFDLIKTANPDVKTSTETKVRAPNQYEPDPYGVVNKDNAKDAYLVMKFGSEALAVAKVNQNGTYNFTDWAARNGMANEPGYAAGLMLTHVDAAAQTKQDNKSDPNYAPLDRYTLSYAPTKGFMSDLWGAFMTKIGVESDTVSGLRNQVESIQGSGKQVNWVTHSRGGAEFVQAVSGSSVDKLYNNSVVFHAGANNQVVTDWVMSNKSIGDISIKDNRYRDAPSDLVPQIVGLRGLSAPWNFLPALLSAPCLSSAFCAVEQSPHTLPYQWNNLQPEAK